VRSSTSSTAEAQTPAPTFRGMARLAIRTLRTRGAAYPELTDYLAAETRSFLAGRVELRGATVLDLGSGHGSSGHSLEPTGARIVSTDRRPLGGPSPVVADATLLPFAAGAFDGAVCSNLLEHVSSPPAVIAELARVVRRGGWVYLSWTPWFGPLGGHEFSPWHYLGIRAARRMGGYVRLGPIRNIPGQDLFPVHVGRTLRGLERTGAFRVNYAGPRYWPSQQWIARVPGLREVALWNCLLLLERA